MTKMESVKQLRSHLSSLFDFRHRGALNVDYARTQGYIDGYMQAMSDLGIVSDRELLQIVAEERTAAAQKSEQLHPGFAPNMAAHHFA